MKCISIFLGIIAGSLLLSGCIGTSDFYRYRITVNVETPEGLVSGTTVREIEYRTAPFAIVQKGEAVILEMSAKKTLYVLMEIDTRELHFATFFWDDFSRARTDSSYKRRDFKELLEEAYYVKRLIKFPSFAEMEERNIDFPRGATFLNESDPLTARAVNLNDLSLAFGKGYELRDITIQMTDDPVTDTIEKHLDWLDARRFYLPLDPTNNTSQMPLYHHNFKQD